MEIIRLKGVYKDYLWGGRKLNDRFNKNSGLDKTAESWELSVHPDGPSIIDGGEYDGMYLSDYIKKNPSVLGKNRISDELPILIKLIDAEQDLSIQVHPDNKQAWEWEKQNGKTEMWYILDADKDAQIVYGVKENVLKEELKDSIINNTVEELLAVVPSKKGDVFFVDAGTIHAIGKGNLIVEIQQNSNVTYRLYDYDRRDKNGKPRELHIEKGIEAANNKVISKRKIPMCSDGSRLIGSCEYFAAKEIKVENQVKLNCSDASYQALIVTDGSFELSTENIKETLNTCDTVFLPAGFGGYTLKGNGTVIQVGNPPRYSVGIDLGGTNIVAAVVDEDGVIYGRSKCKTESKRGYELIFDDMIACAKDAVKESGLLWNDIDNVGIGCPGAIDKEKGIVDFSNNLNFYDVPIVEYIEKRVGKKVYVENDANSAAWGEFLVGEGKECKNMILLTLGTGVGSGVVIDGHLFRGAFGTGAELGHMIIISNGEQCTCGRRGCLEAYASATALIEQTKRSVLENADTEIWKMIDGDVKNIDGKTAFDCKDDVARKIVSDYTGYLAEGVVSIVNMFQPEVICLGGGVSGAGDVLTIPLNEAIEKEAFARYGNKSTRVKIASLGNDAGLIGAGLLWKDEI